MGRRKIKIEKIEDDRVRQVTFFKRKTGLIKKAIELSVLCDCKIALVVFNQKDELFEYASAPVGKILSQYVCCKEPYEAWNNGDYAQFEMQKPPSQKKPAPVDRYEQERKLADLRARLPSVLNQRVVFGADSHEGGDVPYAIANPQNGGTYYASSGSSGNAIESPPAPPGTINPMHTQPGRHLEGTGTVFSYKSSSLLSGAGLSDGMGSTGPTPSQTALPSPDRKTGDFLSPSTFLNIPGSRESSGGEMTSPVGFSTLDKSGFSPESDKGKRRGESMGRTDVGSPGGRKVSLSVSIPEFDFGPARSPRTLTPYLLSPGLLPRIDTPFSAAILPSPFHRFGGGVGLTSDLTPSPGSIALGSTIGWPATPYRSVQASSSSVSTVPTSNTGLSRNQAVPLVVMSPVGKKDLDFRPSSSGPSFPAEGRQKRKREHE